MLAVMLHVGVGLLATAQRLVSGLQINNFLIFRSSFFHLLAGRDLYAAYPAEHFDLYKYSPTWALLFAPFAVVPIGAGVLIWNATNAIALCVALAVLLPARAASIALGVCFFEALGSMQNAQSNGIVAALMISALIAAEKGHRARGAGAIAVGASIKLFPAAAGVFGLLNGGRWRHLGWSIAAGAFLLGLPLLVTPAETLAAQYRSWLIVETRDHAEIGMLWLGGAVEHALGRPLAHWPIQLFGVAWIGATCVVAAKRWSDADIRRLLLATLLVFATIFNHQAESPSYVIAFAGIGIWWSVLPRARWRDSLVFATVLLGSLGGTDLVPRAWRVAYYHEWRLKAVVTSLAWIAMQVDIWRAVGGVSGWRSSPVAMGAIEGTVPGRDG